MYIPLVNVTDYSTIALDTVESRMYKGDAIVPAEWKGVPQSGGTVADP
jgi:hypothetical protein